MSEWLQCIGPCIKCRAVFAFNPMRVPSVIINGEREPVCRTCIDWANIERANNGMPEIVILPGAYEAEEIN